MVMNHNVIVFNDADPTRRSRRSVLASSLVMERTPPVNTRVQGNLILKNAVDIIWDGAGTGNVFQPNWCQTSDPPGLCG